MGFSERRRHARTRGQVLGLVMLLMWGMPLAAASKPPKQRRYVEVEFAKDFRLKKGETARLPGGRAFLRIKSFINSPCPKGAQCVWSGLLVMHELTVDGKVVPANSKAMPYVIVVKSSDYRSYAVFNVDEPEAACGRLPSGVGDECLRRLAVERRSPKRCQAIPEARTRGLCLEDVAELLEAPEWCREVEKPSQYCLYVRAQADQDLAACDGIVLFRWRVRCFKEISASGAGAAACAALEPEVAGRCRELIEGPDE